MYFFLKRVFITDFPFNVYARKHTEMSGSEFDRRPNAYYSFVTSRLRGNRRVGTDRSTCPVEDVLKAGMECESFFNSEIADLAQSFVIPDAVNEPCLIAALSMCGPIIAATDAWLADRSDACGGGEE